MVTAPLLVFDAIPDKGVVCVQQGEVVLGSKSIRRCDPIQMILTPSSAVNFRLSSSAMVAFVPPSANMNTFCRGVSYKSGYHALSAHLDLSHCGYRQDLLPALELVGVEELPDRPSAQLTLSTPI
jgi:hypothetical protein